MKRREVLKGLTTIVGGTLLPSSAWSIFSQQITQDAALPLAVPIRALARKNGALVQPVQISIRHSGASATAMTKLNDAEVDRRVISEGVNTFQVFTDPVDHPQEHVTVAVTVGTSLPLWSSLSSRTQASRRYICHSHHDSATPTLSPDRRAPDAQHRARYRSRPQNANIPKARASFGT